MKKYEAVIFDLDGTLFDTLDDLTDAVNFVCKEFGYPLRTREVIRTFLGNGIERTARLAVPEVVGNEEFAKVFASFKKYYTSHCQIKTKPYAGMLELLQKLQERGYKLAIVSNKNAAAVEALNELYFSDYVKVAIGESETVKKKPAPDSVLKALDLLGIKREEAVYVGDSEVDKATADNVGMDSILVTWGFRDKPQLEKLQSTYLVNKPEEILTCCQETTK